MIPVATSNTISSLMLSRDRRVPARNLFTRACSLVFVALSAVSHPLHAADKPVEQADAPWRDARQLVLVTTPGWDAGTGSMETFTRTAQGWQPAAGPKPVAIGRAGAAWGLGLHPPQGGLAKKEGDGRSPAGVFRIGDAFGYAGSASTDMRYLAMGDADYCIDVNASPLYNRIVDARVVGTDAVAGSTEPMRRDIHADGDQRYKLGFVIEHNPANVSGAGSCIFAHLWKAPDEPTAGCTAMKEPAMVELFAWLQPGQRPVFVLLPQREYARLKDAWRLPDSAAKGR